MADREAALAARYEAKYPETDVPVAQKAERQERRDFYEESRALRRTGRTRGVVIPRLPWLDEQET